jgi:hypothetical protein
MHIKSYNIYVVIHNMKVRILIEYYCSAWQQRRDKLQASTGERRHINTEEVNKQKRRREIHKERNNYVT